jgi:hypothetical protein
MGEYSHFFVFSTHFSSPCLLFFRKEKIFLAIRPWIRRIRNGKYPGWIAILLQLKVNSSGGGWIGGVAVEGACFILGGCISIPSAS